VPDLVSGRGVEFLVDERFGVSQLVVEVLVFGAAVEAVGAEEEGRKPSAEQCDER
jgi:hypothetical protein